MVNTPGDEAKRKHTSVLAGKSSKHRSGGVLQTAAVIGYEQGINSAKRPKRDDSHTIK
jgi:hypothetical protein